MPASSHREHGHKQGSSGRISIVSTPIGNLEDITLRALRVLRESDLIAAEDTRRTRKLLSHFDIHTPLTSYYQQQQVRRGERILEAVRRGGSVALVTDAGTPGISDPGAVLVRMAVEEGVELTVVPGPSAVIALLAVSGLPTDRFVFEGFLPLKPGKKRRRLEKLAVDDRTLIFYEAPHRLVKTLQALREVLGNRQAAVGRELTKVHEEVQRGLLDDILRSFTGRKVRGELTIAVAGRRKGEPDVDAGP